MPPFNTVDTPLLTVYKASAGSGKTWRLTVEYVKLILQRPDSYRNTLAVTFTNKATAEMKERILNALWTLSHLDIEAQPDGMTATLIKETGLTPATIKANASLSLQLLIHDYARFRVETIDSYLQSILRNLARELGIGTGMNIELSNETVLGEAVDDLLDRSHEDPERLNWITDYIEEQYREGSVLRIDNQLREFGKTIFQEHLKEKAGALQEQLASKGFLQRYKRELQTLLAKKEAALKQATVPFFDLLTAHDLTIDDLSNKSSGPAGYFIKLQKGVWEQKSLLGARAKDAMDNPDAWVSKTHPRRKELTALAIEHLTPLLQETERLRQSLVTDIATCRLCIKHLSNVGLLTDIDTTVNRLNREANRFLLSDTNALLSSLITGQDASFVFERTGTELHHFLFDEFQDTSRLQWATFKPILLEGLSNGNRSLVVGDEKQAIYRWRNGDWRILSTLEHQLSTVPVQVRTLNQNWRSDPVVIRFNNTLFEALTAQGAANLDDEVFNGNDLRQAYATVAQQSVRTDEAGYVSVRFLSNEDLSYQETTLDQLLQEAVTLQQRGVRADQIAILVRHNKSIPDIAAYFAAHRDPALEATGVSYTVISDEAFLLSSSTALKLLITALRVLTEPNNPLLLAQLTLDYHYEVCGGELPLHDVLQADTLPNTQPHQPTEGSATQEDQATATIRQAAAQHLPPGFLDQQDDLRQTPLHELVETLFRLFSLDQLDGQDSYLYTFMDKLTEYLSHHPSDLPSFLTYWDESLCKVSVPSGAGVNGLRILSIHKSKGLEFHTVLLPFCDWSLDSEKIGRTELWCQPDRPPYNQLDLLPATYKDSLLESIFAEDYKLERSQLYLDSVNLLYVALTRAVSNLLVLSKGRKPTKGPTAKAASPAPPKSIAELLYDTLHTQPVLAAHESEPGHFTFGQLQHAGVQQTNAEGTSPDSHHQTDSTATETTAPAAKPRATLLPKGSDIPVTFVSHGQKVHFRQSTRSKAFSQGWGEEGYHNQFIDRGKRYHYLFSAIHTANDVEAAVNDLVHEGLLSLNEVEETLTYAQKALQQPQAADWFSGRYKLFNECSILTHDNQGHTVLKRPDRVMLAPDHLTVVDFKFGQPAASHQRQVAEYMQLLTQMGYPNVQGYLWYVDNETVVTVSPSAAF